MFLRAFWRLSKLKASTMIVASNSGVSNTCHMACMAASHPASYCAHSWSGPAIAWISCFKVVSVALLMMRQAVSPIPMGLTPGHLSSEIRQLAVNSASPLLSTYGEQICLAMEAMASQRSAEREEQSCFRTAVQIICPSVFLNMMKCDSFRSVSGSIMADGSGDCLAGVSLSELPALSSSVRRHPHYLLM